MGNVALVSEHLGGPLTIVPTREGDAWWDGGDAGTWRVYRFVEGARTLPVVSTAAQAAEAGRAVGEFHRRTADLSSERLAVTLPRFHDPAHRFEAFTDAVERDSAGRRSSCRAEVDALFAHRSLLEVVPGLLTRVAHNDAKLDNVLFDVAGDRALGLVDLDTVMPGTILWDVGDLVRTATCPAREDEPNVARVQFRADWFDALVAGYLAEAGAVLSGAEIAAIALAGPLVTFEQALRFLTDHVDGDRYYRVRHPGHNLVRARTQLRLLDAMLCEHPRR